MEQVYNRIALVPVRGVARRQVDEDVAIRRVVFEIAFERRAVDLDALDLARLWRRALSHCRAYGDCGKQRDERESLNR
jgi:hypothetical protein